MDRHDNTDGKIHFDETYFIIAPMLNCNKIYTPLNTRQQHLTVLSNRGDLHTLQHNTHIQNESWKFWPGAKVSQQGYICLVQYI